MEQKSLFEFSTGKKETSCSDLVTNQKPRVKKDGIITISERTFKTDQNEEGYRLIIYGERGTSIDFSGHNEGMSCMYTDRELAEKSVQERVKEIIKEKSKSKEYNYKFKIVDERIVTKHL